MEGKSKSSPKRRLVGFYWRKLVFFAFAAFLVIFGYSGITYFSADTNSYTPVSSTADLVIHLNILSDGNVTIDGKKTGTRVDTTGNSDELILPVLDNTGTSYDSVKVVMTLPKDVTSTSSYDIKGIHGVDSTQVSVVSANILDYYATGVSSAATLSVIINMPKGTVSPPFYINFYSYLVSVKVNIWLVFAIGLPILTLIYMLLFISYQSRRQNIELPVTETNSPPMSLPPGIAGVLYHQKVGPREIAATLIDLAQRGDIYIVDRERDFAFVKNKLDQRLLSYEKILLSKIFSVNISSDKEEIERRINNHLYSQKMTLVATSLYVLATRLGYFHVNPQKIHRKYQFIGMVSFFASVAGFFLSILIFTNPPYILFFWVGMMLSGIVITATAGKIPNRTPMGGEALSNWLAFRKYLSNAEKIPFDFRNQDLFQKYLPYAIVLDCEVAWAKRFSEQNFTLPSWYMSSKPGGSNLQDFCLSLFPIVSYVARSLSDIREPGYD